MAGRKRIEITPGTRFGRLTILREAAGYTRRHWLCRCDCGREKVIDQGHLRSGHTRSCGCLALDIRRSSALDLTGQRFGNLTALEATPERRKTSVVWRCLCDCGKETLVESETLTRGKTRSCGCLAERQRRENMKKAIHFADGTCIERIANQRQNARNTSGHRGVTRRPDGKWRAEITFQGKRYHLGYFGQFEDAVKARLRGEEMYADYLREYYARQECK